MPFQTKVNVTQAPGVRGDFASMNPFSSMLAGPGALVSPVGGVIVGHFAFVNPADLSVHQAFTSGYQIGFLGRNEQALITTFLAESTMIVPVGFMVNLFSGGDFWARFMGGITAGGTVYADTLVGAPNNATTTTATASAGFTGTASLGTVGGVAQLTIATVTGGSILSVGDTVTGTGITAGTTVVALLSGTGGVGSVYSLSQAVTTEAAEAVTSTSTLLHVTALITGGLNVFDTITGTGVTAGTTLTSVPAQGSLGLGQYGLSVAQNFASTTVTGPTSTATQFKAATSCLPGEIAKISAFVT